MKRHERIRRAADRAGLSVLEIAGKVPCSPDYVRKILRGEFPRFKMLIVERIEKVVGLNGAGK